MALDLDHPVRVGIDGISAAGKTIFSDELSVLLRRLGMKVIQATIDGFHNPKSFRYRDGRLSSKGYYDNSFDYGGVRERLLVPLGPAGSRKFQRKIFDFRSNSRVESPLEEAPPGSILLLDGVMLLRPELVEYLDYKIFVEIDFFTSLDRMLGRDARTLQDIKSLRHRFVSRYAPGQLCYLKKCRPFEKANIVIQNRDFLKPRLLKPLEARELLTAYEAEVESLRESLSLSESLGSRVPGLS